MTEDLKSGNLNSFEACSKIEGGNFRPLVRVLSDLHRNFKEGFDKYGDIRECAVEEKKNYLTIFPTTYRYVYRGSKKFSNAFCFISAMKLTVNIMRSKKCLVLFERFCTF